MYWTWVELLKLTSYFQQRWQKMSGKGKDSSLPNVVDNVIAVGGRGIVCIFE